MDSKERFEPLKTLELGPDSHSLLEVETLWHVRWDFKPERNVSLASGNYVIREALHERVCFPSTLGVSEPDWPVVAVYNKFKHVDQLKLQLQTIRSDCAL